MEFSRQKYQSRLSFPTPRDLSNPEIKPVSFASLTSAGRFFTTVPLGSPDSERFGLLSQQMATTLTRLKSILVLCWSSRAFFTRAHNSPGSICLTVTDVPKAIQLSKSDQFVSNFPAHISSVLEILTGKTLQDRWDDDGAWCGLVPVSLHPSFTIRIFCFQLVRRILDVFSSLLGANCMSHSFPATGGLSFTWTNAKLPILPHLLQSALQKNSNYHLFKM